MYKFIQRGLLRAALGTENRKNLDNSPWTFILQLEENFAHHLRVFNIQKIN